MVPGCPVAPIPSYFKSSGVSFATKLGSLSSFMMISSYHEGHISPPPPIHVRERGIQNLKSSGLSVSTNLRSLSPFMMVSGCPEGPIYRSARTSN